MKTIKQCIALLFCFSLVALVGCTQQIPQEDTIATVNGKAISKAEYMVYLYEATRDFTTIGGDDIWDTDFDGQSAEDLVKERAFSAMLQVKLAAEKAPKYNVSLTEEEKELAKTNGDAELANMAEAQRTAIGISQEDMYKIMEDSLTYQKVADALTKDYQLSENDFKAYFEAQKDASFDAYTKYTIRTILVAEETTAKEVIEKLNHGEDFDTLFQNYEIDTQAKTSGKADIVETYRSRLEAAFGIPFTLEAGQISDPIPTAEGYFIVEVLEKSIPTEMELQELLRTDYTLQMRQKVFNDEVSQWMAEAEVERNDTVWDTIDMLP